MSKRTFGFTLAGLAALAIAGVVMAQSAPLTPKEDLGKQLFFDTNLSNPPGQACAACHAPSVGFTGPDSAINAGGAVYPGAVPTRFGNRKPPAAAYASGPILHKDSTTGLWVGGTFWDGRATGWTLADPLAEQAQGPFLNPLEMNMMSPADVCLAVQASSYAGLFEQVWGAGSLDCSATGVALTYERIARSIAVYERSSEVSAFTSKYDLYLAGKVLLTGQEKKGLLLFEGKAMCAQCHVSRPGPSGEPPMFTDFTFDNLGLPRNPQNPFYDMPPWNPDGAAWVDPGLGGFLKSIDDDPAFYGPEMGKHKVPTLRNVALRPDNQVVKAYGHNGYFKSLQSIVHFYNTRDVLGPCDMQNNPKEGANCWPAPEMMQNMNTTELGDLGLKPHEEEAIVEFLRTLSDGYTP